MIEPGYRPERFSESDTSPDKKSTPKTILNPQFTPSELVAISNYVKLFPDVTMDFNCEKAITYFLALADSIRDERQVAILRGARG